MATFQSLLHAVEVGKWRMLTGLIPLLTALLIVAGVYDTLVYHGLNDPQSMDTAQLARRIARGDGYTTEFLRPYAITQLTEFASRKGGSGQLFPPDQFPPGKPRILPDTYNAPGYPLVLAAFFKILKPDFNLTAEALSQRATYSGEQFIPALNQLFLLLTGAITFFLGQALFDRRVAWTSAIGFLLCDLVWRCSLTALATCLLTLLVTAVMFCVVRIYRISETPDDDKGYPAPFWPVWAWGLAAALLLAFACLTQFLLLVLLLPLFLIFILMPRPSYALLPVIALIIAGAIAPWFWYMYKICGNPLGSNLSLLLRGTEGFEGNQVYRHLSFAISDRLLKDAVGKQLTGFRWNFEHAWTLLGANPLVLFFAASTVYPFRRSRARAFRWLVLGSAICLVCMGSLGVPEPDPIGSWNLVMVLLPSMLVVGSAFFFIMLERLNLHLEVLKQGLIIILLVVTAFPLLLSLTVTPARSLYPPYSPYFLNYTGQLAKTDEWVTTDMPWATAWYADRASLWFPDSVKDFNYLHDNVCPTGILILTPVSLAEPFLNMTSGENKDWLPLVTYTTLPVDFPFTAHVTSLPGQPEYFIWSDSSRWQKPR